MSLGVTQTQRSHTSWPVILTSIVSSVSTVNHALEIDDPKLAEGKELISALSGLKHSMGRNSVLQYELHVTQC